MEGKSPAVFAILCFVLVFYLNLQLLLCLEWLVDRAHLLTSALTKVLLPVFAGGSSSQQHIIPSCVMYLPVQSPSLDLHVLTRCLKQTLLLSKFYKGTALWLFLVVQQTDRTPFVPNCDFAYIGAHLEESVVTLLVI